MSRIGENPSAYFMVEEVRACNNCGRAIVECHHGWMHVCNAGLVAACGAVTTAEPQPADDEPRKTVDGDAS